MAAYAQFGYGYPTASQVCHKLQLNKKKLRKAKWQLN